MHNIEVTIIFLHRVMSSDYIIDVFLCIIGGVQKRGGGGRGGFGGRGRGRGGRGGGKLALML